MTAEPEVLAAIRGVARVASPAAPRVRAIPRAESSVVPAPGRARGATSVPWSPVVEDSPPEHRPGPARGVAAVPGRSTEWRVRASVPPIVVARRAVAPGPSVPLDVAMLPAPAAVEPPRADAIEPVLALLSPVYIAGRDTEPPVDRPGAAFVPSTAAPPRVPRRSLVRRALLPVSVAAAAGLVAATGYLVATQPRQVSDTARWSAIGAAPAPRTRSSSNPLAGANGTPFGAAARQPQGLPTRLRVTAIGVDTALESLHLGADGTLTPPRDFARAGWYADGTAPGDPGPAVIAGHVDSHRGPAVFYRLRELQPGDRIEVMRGGETERFTVVTTAWYPKTTFPSDRVYGPTPDRQLRLITCGGVFDHHQRSYEDNLVVYAVAG